MFKPLRRFHGWYARYERLFSSISLFGGFIFDAVTLKRIDLLMENVWIVVHLLVAAIGIIALNVYENKERESEDAIRFWLIFVIQFAFGGLFSTFLVFYFRSTTLSATWPFLVFLGLAFILNESFKKHYTRLVFQINLFFIALYAFAIYLVPVVFHTIGSGIFILSGIVSLLALRAFIFVLTFISREKFRQSRRALIGSIAIVTLVINVLYFVNLIPPIPLSLKDAGVYHDISRTATGDYIVTHETRSYVQDVVDFFRSYEMVHKTSNESLYAYSAVFSPGNFNLRIVHEWQRYDDAKGFWRTVDRIELPIVGGREGGYRTYSREAGLTPGLWRVNIETLTGQVIGRLKFNVITTDTPVTVENEIKS